MNPVPPRLLFIFHCSKKSDFLTPLIYIELSRMRATVFSGSPFETTEHAPPLEARREQCFTPIHGTFHADRIGGFVLPSFPLRSRKQNDFRCTSFTRPSRYNARPRGRAGGGEGIVRERPFRRVRPDARFNTYAVGDTVSTHGFQERLRCVYEASVGKRLRHDSRPVDARLALREGIDLRVLTAKTYTTKTEKWREDTARRRRRNTGHARRARARRLVATTQFIRLCPTGECDGR